MSSSEESTWKIGALATLTGLTVRALHHYDHLGLLRPSRRTASGHRLYTGQDVARLYRISLLRRLGFSLEQIAGVLENPQWQLPAAIGHHLDVITRRVEIAQSLRVRLSRMAGELTRHDSPSPDELFSILEEMSMLDSTVHRSTALLVYDDILAAQEYLVRVFGLTAGELTRNDDNVVVHGEVSAGEQVIWLHPAGDGYQSPRTLGAVTSMTAIAVDDVDAHYARALAAGATIIAEPVNQPYGLREYGACDPEAHRWYFQTPWTD